MQNNDEKNLTKFDLEHDLNQAVWLIEKVRLDRNYAQNLYAALCNMQWQKQEVWPVLNNDLWGCSWRYAGGLVARLEGKGGDYLDWYCSGIGDETPDTGRWIDRPKTYVPEGTVTDEIREDLGRLGWTPVGYDDDGY